MENGFIGLIIIVYAIPLLSYIYTECCNYACSGPLAMTPKRARIQIFFPQGNLSTCRHSEGRQSLKLILLNILLYEIHLKLGTWEEK